jgi:hypothetical protein
MSCPYKTPGCNGDTFHELLCTKFCRAPLVYAHETAQGLVVSFGAKWGIYTCDGILVRKLSQQEARTIVNAELVLRALPRGEDR